MFNSCYSNGISFSTKRIEDWYSDECLAWATSVEGQLSIPYSSLVSIHGFAKVTGRDLLRYKSSDFKRIVNEEYGPLFYKAFKVLARRESKDLSEQLSNVIESLNYSTWTDSVPQLGAGDLPIPQISYGEESFAEPPYFAPSLPLDMGDAFGDLNPAYSADGGSPFGGSSPCFGLSSPSYSLDVGTSFETRNETSLTYFRQPVSLSGGSVSYGTSGGSMLSHSFNETSSEHYGSVRPATLMPDNNYFDYCNSNQSLSSLDGAVGDANGSCSPMPDLASLGITDDWNNSSDYLNIDKLDCSLREETFLDLDKIIHDDDSLMLTNDQVGNQQDNGFASNDFSGNEFAELSHLSAPENTGTLEDCLLKKITTGKRGNRVRHPQSWEFLVRILLNPQTNPSLVKWEDKENGIFRLIQKEEIARLWGKRSQKHKDEPLAYDNFARILRYHYKSKMLLPVSDKHLVYQLGKEVLSKLRHQGLL